MADYNRRGRNPSYDRDWDQYNDRGDRRSDYDRYGNYGDYYGSVDYDRDRRDYDSRFTDSNRERRDYHRGYNWDDNVYSSRRWRDNDYGSYNAGYSDQDYRRGRDYEREDEDRRSAYNRPYRTGNNYEDYGPYSGSRVSRDRDEDRYRSSRYDRDDRRERSWWDRTADEISSWFGDEDAERRRRMDKVSGPYRGKGPKGYSRSDERIKEDINDRLSDDPYIDASDIEVKVANGEVTLSGHTNSKEAKRRAEDIAESISGVREVENHVKVSRTTASVGSSNVYLGDEERRHRRSRDNWF